MKNRYAALVVLAVACAPEIPNTPPGEFVVARFDPSAAPPVVPTPNDLVTNTTTGLLVVPVPAEASAADKWFYDWLNTLNGFPAAVGASVTFTHALDPATVTASTVRAIDLDASNATVDVTRTYTDSTSTVAPGQLAIAPPTGGWLPGHRYALAIVGGLNGVRSKTGLTCVGSATWSFIRNAGELIDCPNDDLASTSCRLTTEIIPSTITEDQGRRVTDQLATAKRLETLRRKYKPAIDAFVAAGVQRADLALLWTFRIDDSASFVFDPTASKVPSPNNLAIKQGLVASPIDPNASAAAQEWTRTWLNTLNGFPPTTAAGAEIAQQDLDPTTLNERTVRVSVQQGGALVGPPTISWNARLKRLVISPAAGSWGSAKTVSVAVLGGASGVKGLGGKRLVASQVWALVRSAAPLVDCEVLGPACNSFVKAAPISTSQAIALESLRRTYKPLLDSLEAQGVPRRDVAGAWIFSTTDQPELVFDPAAIPARLPTPTDLAVNPTTGLVNTPVPPGASPAYAEFITEYLNTLNGFPVASTSVAELSGDVDPSSIDSNTVRVQVVSGPALVGSPTITFDPTTSRLSVAPPNGSWGKGRTIAVTVLGGPAGIRSRSGKPLVASQAFSFVKLSNTLVDAQCTTLGASCRSVTLLSDAQAVALEPVRRALKPVFDSLESTGIPRDDVAGLWVFHTVNQPELTFDLGQGVVPFPNNHLLRGNTLPDGGVQSGFVVVLPDGGAPGDDAVPGVRLSLPTPTGASLSQAQLVGGLNTLDGFSTTAPIVSENSPTLAALDQGSIDAGSLSAVGLLKLGASSDAGTRFVACLNCTSSLNDAGVMDQPQQLQWVPQTPLDENARYAAYVPTSVRDTQGRAVMAAPTFALVRLRSPLVDGTGASTIPVVSNAQAQQLEPIRRRFKDCLDRLETAGTPRSTQALAFCFTTQSITAPIRATAAAVASMALPTTPTWMLELTGMTRLGLTFSGVPNASIDAVVDAELVVPNPLTGPGGGFSENPSTWSTTTAIVTVTVPRPPAPAGGFPVVLFMHPLGGSRADLWPLADRLASLGLAVVAIDAPLHGDRSDCRLAASPDSACANPGTQECNLSTGRCVSRTPGSAQVCPMVALSDCFMGNQGRCLSTGRCEGGSFARSSSIGNFYGTPVISGQGFFDATSLASTTGRMRQAALTDLVQVLRVLDATGPTSLDGLLSSRGFGRLNTQDLRVLGVGLGGVFGVTLAAGSSRPGRVAISASGGDLTSAFLTAPGLGALRDAFAAGRPSGTARFDEAVVLARTMLDGTEPLNLVATSLGSATPSRQLFVQTIEGDDQFPADGTSKVLRLGLAGSSASRLAWFTFTPHSGTAAAGQFPASWPVRGRAGFLLRPGGAAGSATINPECDSTNSAFNAATCATTVAQSQIASFLSTGSTPANVPVTP